MTRTRRVVRSPKTSGNAPPLSWSRARRIAALLAASRVKSSSCLTPFTNSATTFPTPKRAADSERRLSCRASQISTRPSRSTDSSTPGRCTLTMTLRPSGSVARWVTPIEAAASGCRSNSAKRTSSEFPNSRSITSRTSSGGRPGTAVRSSASSRIITAGSRSSRVEAIWPNLISIPPDCSSVRRSARAPSGVARLRTDRTRRPTSPLLRAARMICRIRLRTERRSRITLMGCGIRSLRRTRGRKSASMITLASSVMKST